MFAGFLIPFDSFRRIFYPAKDEFTIVRLVTIFIQADGGTKPVVIPHDVVNPELMRHVRDTVGSLPYKVDLPVIRGGLSFNPEWKELPPLPPPPYIKKFYIPDRNKFLSKPSIQLNDKTYIPHLAPGDIQELMTQGTTLVTINKDEEKILFM